MPAPLNEPSEILHYNQEDQKLSYSQCNNREKIQRGLTSIYIFEGHHQECIEDVRNKVAKSDGEQQSSEGEPRNLESNECAKNFKRSANNNAEEEETVVVIRKRGNKVFIEI